MIPAHSAPILAQCLAAALVLAAAAGATSPPPVRWTVEKVAGPGTTAGFPEIPGVEHHELMRVTSATGTYYHHAHILHDGERFYATWSNHLCCEDGPGQRVRYALSDDGRRWTTPQDCVPPMGPIARGGVDSRVLTANGLHRIDGTVYAIAGVNDRIQGQTGRVIHGNLARAILPDGTLGPMFWLTRDVPASFAGFPFVIPGSSDPRFAAVAERMLALRYRPENIPSWSFFPGGRRGDDYTVATGNWRSFGGTMRADDGHLMCEPTGYRRPDGVAVRLFRDLEHSRRVYPALYDEANKSWSVPTRTNIPDSASRAVAGRLPNGGVYLVGNQTWGALEGKGIRDPLVLSVSRDGIVFDRAWIIRAGTPPMRHRDPGKGLGFQYPHATVVGHDLWVIYSINKEDIAVTRVPLPSVFGAMAAEARSESGRPTRD